MWVRTVYLSEEVRVVLRAKKTAGQKNACSVLRARTKERESLAQCAAREAVKALDIGSIDVRRALLATYYWCEGAKSPNDLVAFTNSDPSVIRAFVSLMRACFVLDESKFRCMLHLHACHNSREELRYWSKVTSIRVSQFFQPYQKVNSGVRQREGYRGCAQVRYYDVAVARELLALGRTLTATLGSIS